MISLALLPVMNRVSYMYENLLIRVFFGCSWGTSSNKWINLFLIVHSIFAWYVPFIFCSSRSRTLPLDILFLDLRKTYFSMQDTVSHANDGLFNSWNVRLSFLPLTFVSNLAQSCSCSGSLWYSVASSFNSFSFFFCYGLNSTFTFLTVSFTF